MRDITVTVYKIGELPDKARKRAIVIYRDTKEILLSYVLAEASESLAALGVTLDRSDIQYSGFASQGDGASFTGYWRASAFRATTDTVAKEFAPYVEPLRRIAQRWPDITVEIDRTRSRYVHSRTMHCSTGVDAGELGSFDVEDFASIMRDIADAVYSMLECEYDYQTTDEYILDSMEANECEFYGNGDAFYG